jgi:L-iditol 2-dehydrogenase
MSDSVMRAAILTKPETIELGSMAIPTLDPDQVLVQVEAVGVCGSDVHFYEHGRIGSMIVESPLVLGHELSGTIVQVGSNVSADRVGKRVAVEPQRPCTKCEYCQAGKYNLCLNIEFYAAPPIDGAFCEFVKIQDHFAFEIPDSVSFNAAALMEPLSVAIWTMKKANMKAGDRVLIAGAGPIGLIVAQTAQAMGAASVTITDVSPQRLEFALAHGADKAIDITKDNLDGIEADVFVDASGNAKAVYDGISHLAAAGYAVLVGMGADDMMLPVAYIQNKEITVTGIFRYTNTWPEAIELVASGKVDLDCIVTSEFGLAEVEKALNAGKIPGQLKAVVKPQQ